MTLAIVSRQLWGGWGLHLVLGEPAAHLLLLVALLLGRAGGVQHPGRAVFAQHCLRQPKKRGGFSQPKNFSLVAALSRHTRILPRRNRKTFSGLRVWGLHLVLGEPAAHLLLLVAQLLDRRHSALLPVLNVRNQLGHSKLELGLLFNEIELHFA